MKAALAKQSLGERKRLAEILKCALPNSFRQTVS